MYNLSQEELYKLGADITTREIRQQPILWQETLDIFIENKDKINEFIASINRENKKIKVIFTGAGTSQYVGDTLIPYLRENGDSSLFEFYSFATTDIVSAPSKFLNKDDKVLLVSFARSGNSPESLAAVDIADKYVKDIYHLMITCAANGKLSKNSKEDNKLVILMPEKSNDAGFAMTGSFSCMYLSALLIFDKNEDKRKTKFIEVASKLGEEIYTREEEIKNIIDDDFDRIVYLGSGSLAPLTREAQLKVLELTAGKVATVYDSSMGFRHGPKSFINENTLVFGFINGDEYTKKYDVDILEEIKGDLIAKRIIGIEQNKKTFSGEAFVFKMSDIILPDAYFVLPLIVYAQTIALMTAVKIGNKPDTPSPTGTVNRVVKGVKLHDYFN